MSIGELVHFLRGGGILSSLLFFRCVSYCVNLHVVVLCRTAIVGDFNAPDNLAQFQGEVGLGSVGQSWSFSLDLFFFALCAGAPDNLGFPIDVC